MLSPGKLGDAQAEFRVGCKPHEGEVPIDIRVQKVMDAYKKQTLKLQAEKETKRQNVREALLKKKTDALACTKAKRAEVAAYRKATLDRILREKRKHEELVAQVEKWKQEKQTRQKAIFDAARTRTRHGVAAHVGKVQRLTNAAVAGVSKGQRLVAINGKPVEYVCM